MVTLNYRDSRPIYEQIREGLKRLIVTGALAAEERLPSVRTLATQLSINPNTIQRAYAELERDGYCYSVPGKGSFVSGSADMSEKRRGELKERLCALAAELKFLGVAEAELVALVRGAAADGGKKEEKA
ncbi:MAG: GntR family transcriptional regulator [Oscillibacter sp.]|nr:GntR family transcriptional regulator [Oscillibacter sp.]